MRRAPDEELRFQIDRRASSDQVRQALPFQASTCRITKLNAQSNEGNARTWDSGH